MYTSAVQLRLSWQRSAASTLYYVIKFVWNAAIKIPNSSLLPRYIYIYIYIYLFVVKLLLDE